MYTSRFEKILKNVSILFFKYFSRFAKIMKNVSILAGCGNHGGITDL
jgi:hypothetical protein